MPTLIRVYGLNSVLVDVDESGLHTVADELRTADAIVDVDATVLENAIAPDEAARIVLAGADANESMMVFPDPAEELLAWFRDDPDRWDEWAAHRAARSR